MAFYLIQFSKKSRQIFSSQYRVLMPCRPIEGMTIALPLLLQEKATACQKCGECCRRYYISVLPEEAVREAKFFKLKLEQFIGIYCQLFLQVMPLQSGDHPLALHTSAIPKKLWTAMQKSGINSNYVMLLPMLGFKKKEFCVFFDPKLYLCTMHTVKPAQCSLFPFMAGEKKVDFAKAYDFCELASIASPTKYTHAQADMQKAKMAHYFDAVAKNGMEKVWKFLPQEGIVLFQGKAIAPIALHEMQELLQLARGKETN